MTSSPAKFRSAPDQQDGASHPTVAARLFAALRWRSGFVIIGAVCGFANTVFAARIFDTHDFATYIVVMSAFVIAPPVLQLGIGSNAIRRIAELRATGMSKKAQAYGRKSLALIAAVGPVGSIAVAALVLITHPARPLSVLTALAIALWLETLRFGISFVLLAHERQGWAAITSNSSRVGVTAILFAAFYAADVHTDLALVMWLIVMIQAVLAVGSLVVVEPNVATSLRGPASREMITDGLPAMIVDGSNYVLARADVWIAAAVFVDHTDGAAYGAASTLAAQLVLPATFLGAILSPIVRSLWIERRREELDAMLRTVATVATALCGIGALTIAIGAGPILRTVYLPTFGRAAPAMGVLAIGSLAAVISGLSGESLVMCVSLRLAAVVHGTWAVLGLGLLWVGAHYGGLIGLAITSSTATLGISLTQVLIVWRRTGLLTLPGLRLRSRAAALRERKAWTFT